MPRGRSSDIGECPDVEVKVTKNRLIPTTRIRQNSSVCARLNMGILHDLNSSCRSALGKQCLTKANYTINLMQLFTLRVVKPPQRCVALTQTDSPPISAGGGPMKIKTHTT